VIDLAAEQPIPLAAACRLVPPGRNGRKTHISTLIRWITAGSRAPSGERVRLEAVRVGGRWLTSASALQRFAAALTPRLGDDPPAATPAPRTPSQRRRAAERACRELQDAGL
jgi:hypothetical protein